MSDKSDSSDAGKPTPPEEGSVTAVATESNGKRPAFFPSVFSSVGYMRSSAQEEGSRLRGSDFLSVILLPISCALLVAVSWFYTSTTVRAILFLAPLCAFFYYIGTRIGIVKGLSTRQAFLIWHIIMATFLLGCTFTLFLAFCKEAMLGR